MAETTDTQAAEELSCAIIYGEESDEHPAFLQAAEQYFDTVLAVPFTNVRITFDNGVHLRYRETDLAEFDCVFLRFFDTDMLHGERIPAILQDKDVYTQLEPRSLFIASNKFYTIKALADADIPAPTSMYTVSTEEAGRAAEELGYPVVLKLISGYGGQGVMRVQHAEDLAAIVDTLTLFEQDICIQQYIENPGEDIRIVVIGDETYSYKRIGGDDEWRSNEVVGGSMAEFDAPDAMRDAALRAAQVCGMDFCGVDIIESTNGGFYIGEINSAPSLEGDEQRVGIDLYDRTMAYIREKTAEHIEARTTTT